MIFPGFPGVLSFSQVFQVEWEPCINVKRGSDNDDEKNNLRVQVQSLHFYLFQHLPKSEALIYI